MTTDNESLQEARGAVDANTPVGVAASDVLAAGLDLQPAPAISAVTQIFISYRVSSDQRIANALKRLIEGSIEPTPSVFVSGAGGLRPSNVGAIPQMQAAAETAVAFVGVITHASKAREWIFFEAGAAWGGKKLYAPLLVDTKPEDLPNTIEGYQATDANDKDQVRLLLGELASATGGTTRSHFGTRYASFERALRSYPEISTAGGDDATETVDERKRALNFLIKGQYADADRCLDALETLHASDPVYVARLRTHRVAFDDRLSLHDKLGRLEELLVAGPSGPDLFFWIGQFEDRAHQKVSHYRNGIDGGADGFLHRVLLTSLADALLGSGRTAEGVTVLADALATLDRDVQAAASSRLLEHLKDAPPPLRLLLGCHAFAAAGAVGHGAIRTAIEICGVREWNAFGLTLARKLERSAADAAASNQLGIVYQSLGLRSLAFMVYEKASRAGASVSKANMANLVSHGPVAAAGIAILEQHSGPFDSSSPQYPHKVRAALEEQVHSEKTLASELEAAGLVVYHRICELADQARLCREPPQSPDGRFRLAGVEYAASSTTPGTVTFTAVADQQKFDLIATPPFHRTWIRMDPTGPFWIYNQMPDGALLGDRFELSANVARVERSEFVPSTG